jgi:acetyltransferase-like isoleucine patch superfamily enzyme
MNIIIKKAQGSYIEIGAFTHLGGGTLVCAGNDNCIQIGESCMIAEDVDIWSSDTHVITIQGKDTPNSFPIIIGNHVWLGKGVTVLKGVTIGDNAIVGMKSVVTHDLRACTINAGVPAKELQENADWHK